MMELLLVLALALALGILAFRRRDASSYRIVRSLGLGDLSEVHRAVRDRKEFVLKIPRVADRNDLASKERELLASLRGRAGATVYRDALPAPVESFELEGRRVNVFDWRGGHLTAEEIRGRRPGGLDGRDVAWMFNRTLEVLGFVHRAGWVHGAVLPPHLLFHPETHALMLVGWIHAERTGRALRFVPARYADWYPPECRDRGPATPSVDIALAARSLIWLAGGDPLRGEMPGSAPPGIRRFFRGCLLESVRMRCQDAWQLHEEFKAVLEGAYGPPRFRPLALSESERS